jgi:hypothetical protein
MHVERLSYCTTVVICLSRVVKLRSCYQGNRQLIGFAGPPKSSPDICVELPWRDLRPWIPAENSKVHLSVKNATSRKQGPPKHLQSLQKPVDPTRPNIKAPVGSVEIPKHESASIGMPARRRIHVLYSISFWLFYCTAQYCNCNLLFYLNKSQNAERVSTSSAFYQSTQARALRKSATKHKQQCAECGAL